MKEVKRGQIWYCDFGDANGSEQGGVRPCVIIQNDIGNAHSPTTIVCAVTTKAKTHLPTHVYINSLDKPSIVMCEQTRTIDKKRLFELIGELTTDEILRLNRAVRINFGV